MLIGLVVAAIASGIIYLAFGETAALVTVIVLGIPSQLGALFAAGIGWPSYSWWD